MSVVLRIVLLIQEINIKYSKDDMNARIHITRHTLKAEVFFKNEALNSDRYTGRVHYINREDQAGKLLEVESKLKEILEIGKL